MSLFLEILPIVLIAVTIVVVGIFSWLSMSRRRKRLMAWATEKGFWFEKVNHSFTHQFAAFEPFNVGDDRHSRHLIQGRVDGAKLAVFQYHYTVGSGKNETTTVVHACAFETPIVSPGLSIRKEGLHHKLFDAFGGEDIDFESDEFSRKFWVRGPNRKFVYDVVHPRTMEFLMPHQATLWQWIGNHLVLVRQGHLEPDLAESILQDAMEFMGLVPRHLHPSPS